MKPARNFFPIPGVKSSEANGPASLQGRPEGRAAVRAERGLLRDRWAARKVDTWVVELGNGVRKVPGFREPFCPGETTALHP